MHTPCCHFWLFLMCLNRLSCSFTCSSICIIWSNLSVDSDLFVTFTLAKYPGSTYRCIKLISTSACKRKSNSRYHGQLNAKGFKQIAGKHFDRTSTVAPVTNDTTITIVLVLLLLAHWTERRYHIKGSFLKGNVRMAKRVTWKFHRVWNSTVGVQQYWGFLSLHMAWSKMIIVLAKAVRDNQKHGAWVKHSWPILCISPGTKMVNKWYG